MTRTRVRPAPTTGVYRAFYEDDPEEIVFAGRPYGTLMASLPPGAYASSRVGAGTLFREDGRDPFERARFILPTGRVVIVLREDTNTGQTRTP